MRPRIKICCMANPAEAEAAAAAGADLIGLVGPMPSGPGTLDVPACAEIATKAPAWVTPVLLTSSETAAAIETDIRTTQVRCVQIVRHVAPEIHEHLAHVLPNVRRIQVIHVEGPEALDLIPTYADKIDAFLLDSGKPTSGQLGGTGRAHDWSVSAAFVKESPVPVFLAGGLNPFNIGDAIQKVRPFGVDICSGIRTDDVLDPSKMAAFMTAVEGVS